MDKIVILKGKGGDDKLVECLRALFPDCAIEIHEKRSGQRYENFYDADDHADEIYDERLEKYLSFL